MDDILGLNHLTSALLCMVIIIAVGKIILKEMNYAPLKLRVLIGLLFVTHYVAFYFNWHINYGINKDSIKFFKNADGVSSVFELGFTGSQAMSVVIYPLVKIGASYFSLSLLFASISFWAFLECIKYLYSISDSKARYFYLIFFFFTPSLHFWTAGLTKEAVIFPIMTIIFFNINGVKISNLILITSFVLIAIIRPYLFIILVFSFILFNTLSSSFSTKAIVKNSLLFISALLFGLLMLNYFVGFEKVKNIYSEIVVYSQNNGRSSLSLDRTNFIERIGIVLFRPLFFDAKTFPQFIVSLENLALIYALFLFVKDRLAHRIRINSNIYLSFSIVSIICFYSLYMYNLGLASRMRSMFIPYLISFMILSYVQSSYQKKTELPKESLKHKGN